MGLVSRGVVEDHVDIEVGWHGLIVSVQEPAELLSAMDRESRRAPCPVVPLTIDCPRSVRDRPAAAPTATRSRGSVPMSA